VRSWQARVSGVELNALAGWRPLIWQGLIFFSFAPAEPEKVKSINQMSLPVF
jgi:hypothetical protein